MAVFQAGAITSPAPNVLYDPVGVAQAASGMQRNALLAEQSRQQINANEIEQAARAANWILTLPEDQQAAAYAAAVQHGQQYGAFRGADPNDFPGKQRLSMLAALGMPAEAQYRLGMAQSAGAPLDATVLGPLAGGGKPNAAPSAAGTPFVAKNLPADISPDEDAKVRTVWGEARGEGEAGQRAVARVIDNRAKQSGMTPREVVMAPGQFEPWGNPETRKKLLALDPASDEYQSILANVRKAPLIADPTGGATHFYSPQAQAALGRPAPDWASGTPSATIGGHQFYNLGYGPQGGGVAGRTPGAVTVAGPGVPAAGGPPAATEAPVSQQPQAPGVQPPPAPELLANGLTREQTASYMAMRRMGTDPTALSAKVEQWRKDNVAQQKDAFAALHPSVRAVPVEGMSDKRPDGGPGMPGPAVPGRWLMQGSTVVGFSPSIAVPAQAGFQIGHGDYKRDQEKELPDLAAQSQEAQTSQIGIKKALDVLPGISAGAFAERRAEFANLAASMGFHDLERALIGGKVADAQEFAKLMLQQSGTQERQVMGARGGYAAMQIFLKSNPNLALQPEANASILRMQLIARQADVDYANAAQAFAAQQTQKFRASPGGGYQPVSQFNQQWTAQKNPQIYAAAMAAIDGRPWQEWTKSLDMAGPADVQRVIDIVRRADPTATLKWSDNTTRPVRGE